MTIMTNPRGAGERDSGLEDGDIVVRLVSIEVGPEGIHGPTWKWIFEEEASGIKFSELTSQKLTYGEMTSKAMDWALALLGDRACEMTAVELDAELPGSRAVATIRHDEKGWPRITAMRPLDN